MAGVRIDLDHRAAVRGRALVDEAVDLAAPEPEAEDLAVGGAGAERRGLPAVRRIDLREVIVRLGADVDRGVDAEVADADQVTARDHLPGAGHAVTADLGRGPGRGIDLEHVALIVRRDQDVGGRVRGIGDKRQAREPAGGLRQVLDQGCRTCRRVDRVQLVERDPDHVIVLVDRQVRQALRSDAGHRADRNGAEGQRIHAIQRASAVGVDPRHVDRRRSVGQRRGSIGGSIAAASTRSARGQHTHGRKDPHMAAESTQALLQKHPKIDRDSVNRGAKMGISLWRGRLSHEPRSHAPTSAGPGSHRDARSPRVVLTIRAPGRNRPTTGAHARGGR